MIRSRQRFLSCFLVSAALAACGGTTTVAGHGGGASTTSSTSSATGGTATGTGGTGTGGTGGSTGTADAGPPSTVTFSYTPAWAGVTAVDVVGGFGLAGDWMPASPLLKLTAGAAGTWSGSVELAPGQYPYVFHVTGDAQGPANYERYTVDPGVSAFVPCPMMSPTYDAKNPNPCSEVSVPQGAAEAVNAVSGKVLYGGQPIAGYLVVIEREEPASHHFFANRMDSAADGTFSLPVAEGTYRIQLQYPTLLTQTDAARDPLTLKALRRAFSAAAKVSAPMPLPPVDMQYLDYGDLMPTTTATLPTTFTFTVIAGATKARAAVYGTANGTGMNIGDPWWTSDFGTATTAAFTGTFDTAQATETMVKTGEGYFWGTWQELGTGAVWTGESMVLPIKWN
jgi:hypothetical protein